MNDKISISHLLKTEWKVLCEIVRNYKVQTILLMVLSNVSVLSTFIELKFLEYMTNSAAALLKGQGIGAVGEVVCIAASFLAVMLMLQMLYQQYLKISDRFDDQVTADVKARLVNKLSEISYEYYEVHSSYELISMAKDASVQYTKGVYGAMRIIRFGIYLTVYGCMLMRIHFIFIVVILLSIMICFVLSMLVSDKQIDYWRRRVYPETRKNQYFKSIFYSRINQQTIQIQQSFSYFKNRYIDYNQRERKYYLKLNLLTIFTELLTSVLFMIVFGVTAISIGEGVIRGKFEIGYFTMVVALLAKLYGTLKEFSLFLLNNNEYIRVLNAYFEVMKFEDSDSFPDNITYLRSQSVAEAYIDIHNLTYHYPGCEAQVLCGIDLMVNQGEKVAVVGYNGSGKTTLMSVILGLLKSYEGCSYVGATMISAIIQDFGQYQMTIRENIELGNGGRKLSDEKLEEILKLSGLYEFVASKQEGLDTKLGQLEQGVELSKGQWQRLAIARLLACEAADVWVLDEPTAYLDPIAEIEMYKLILKLSGNRTVFFISHRLGFAQLADRTLVIDQGKVTEGGTHTELMEADGMYAKMFRMQKEYYE